MKKLCKYCCFWNCFKLSFSNEKYKDVDIKEKANHEYLGLNEEDFKPLSNFDHQCSGTNDIDNCNLVNNKEIINNLKVNALKNINVFPKKLFNKIESNELFDFEFSKKNIIDYIETQINDNTNFIPLANQFGFEISINEKGSLFYGDYPVIKMKYKINKKLFSNSNINIKLIDKYMNNPEKRIKWDTSLKSYKILENISNEVYVLHYISKSPMIFVSERDVVDKRFDFYENDIYYDFSSSVPDDYIPIDNDVMRMTDYCSLCKMYEEEDNFVIISLSQIDTKFKIPKQLLTLQLPMKYKDWYNQLINEINKDYEQSEL